jgi:glycosyltransferase involved in cell wall biosynthesis
LRSHTREASSPAAVAGAREPLRSVALVVDSLAVGGAEIMVAELAAALAARGTRTVVISLSAPTGSAVEARIRSAGAVIAHLPATSAHSLLAMRRLGRLRRLLRDLDPDVVHTHLSSGNILGALAARAAGRPVVATVHSIVEHPHRHYRARHAIESGALRLASRVIAVGPAVATAHRGRVPAERLAVVLNPARPAGAPGEAGRRARRHELGAGDDDVVLIAVGRLTSAKAWPDLLAAFERVRGTHPSARLVIVGDGEERDLVETERSAHGLDAAVAMLGQRDDVPDLLQAADLFVSSSRVEGAPVAVLEAMAAGLPVVATDVGDVATILPATAGVLVPPGDPAALAAAVSRLLDDPGARRAMGEAGRQLARANHGVDAWLAAVEAVYRDARRP